MKFAVHGILADGAGSGAGSFPILLRALLERGHGVDVFGAKGYTEPRSLEGLPGYRFVPVRSEALRRTRKFLKTLPTRYPSALESQIAHLGQQREAVRRIEAEHVNARYDVVVCTDAQALCRSSLPVVCWPQSPPNSEGSALRDPDVARIAIRSDGVGAYAAVQLFYAYRWLVAHRALDLSDIYLCGSSWARDEWERFGADSERLRSLAYPIDVESFSATTPVGARADGTVTFLWLGRATPRKRLDLFLAAFELFHRREPRASARLVGSLSDSLALQALSPYRDHPAISVDGVRPRSEVPALFSEVDVLVQPSQNENFGFSVAEALAAGRSVVLGPTNGTRDYAGEAGFAFEDYRPDSVAAAMEHAFRAVGRDGPALSARARETARRHFTVQSVAERFVGLCTEALARRARAV